MRTRRLIAAAPLAACLLLSACGGSDTAASTTGPSPAVVADNAGSVVQAVRNSGDKLVAAGSSKFDLSSTTTASGQQVTITGTGAFDYAAKSGTLDLTTQAASRKVTISERIVGDAIYLKLSGQPGYYKLLLKDLVGTSIGSSADPSSSFATLKGVSDDVKKVGTEQVRGAQATHYTGTVSVKKALAALDGPLKKVVQQGVGALGVDTLPFDVFLDDQGRLVRYVQHLTAKAQGAAVDSTTTYEAYDFGTKVDVTAPPADQVKDGAPLLASLKGGRS